MMAHTPPDDGIVTQVFPRQRQMPLVGLYLEQRLAAAAETMGRSLVLTNFITDRKGVIAKGEDEEHFHVPSEIKNASDWRLFQELLAQADVMISSSSYFRRVAAAGSRAQNVLSQFEPGGEFAMLGEWRLAQGYQQRSPDLAIVTRSLDFSIPDPLQRSNRRVFVFTTHAAANAPQAHAFNDAGVTVVGSGEMGVDGGRVIDWLSDAAGYRVIMQTAGPGVLHLLLAAQRLDTFYITEAQRVIPLERPADGRTLLPDGKKVGQLNEFRLAHQFVQEHVLADDGALMTQFFLRYDRKRQRERAQPDCCAGRRPSSAAGA